MSAKTQILNAIRKRPLPNILLPKSDSIPAVTYENKTEAFINILTAVGGKAVFLEKGNTINNIIREVYPKAQQITSLFTEIPCVNRNPETENSPHNLRNVDVSIIKGDWGVAENAAIWINQHEKYRAVYFIALHLVILLKKENILHNMHEVYKKIKVGEKGFGIFISGPSKTADIEQSLVVGAHGPKSTLIILTE